MTDVVVSAVALGTASLAGSAVGFVFRNIPHKLNDIFLGFCAGMMLGASLVCLILEGLDVAGSGGWWQVALGVIAGVAIISGIDGITPHLHNLSGLGEMEEHPHIPKSVGSVLLFVTAIAIHKFPEGMATGITFDGHNVENAWAVTISIALQNVPEGLVVVTPLLLIGVKKVRTIFVAIGIAFIEITGVFTGYFLGGISAAFLPALLGLAGGAMLYVLSDEMIPETHAHGFQKQSTYALVAGVMVLLIITRLTE
ncbi:MAG: ZIP family metal transporter [Firmicutes bacterium]|nr:ZIP family metal transporter [Bacillota bacterium]MCM1401190.1 ZIP family metal transporter [Bacteroides sp.]MCM1477113.1 ZIP family metal transporter [Bacteroides sp.]